MHSDESAPGDLIRALLVALFTVGAAPALAQPVINEFVVDHTGTDVNEFIEIFGSPNMDYSAYTLLEIEGDSGLSTGVIDDGVFPVGTTDANGIWVTDYVNNVLENGTLTLLLVQNFTGITGDDIDTNDDGVIDNAPWDRIVDDVGVPDSTGDVTYSRTKLGDGFDGNPFQPGGASRIPDGTDTDTTADWTRNSFDGEGLPCFPNCGTLTGDPAAPGEAYNTAGLPNQQAPAVPVINEFVLDHTGSDVNEFVEIFGSPNKDYSAYTLVEIEGDSGSAGLIDDGVFPVGTTDARGFWVTGYDPGGSNDFENGTLTLLLVRNFTGTTATDIDLNDDGVIDNAQWDQIVDSVGRPDSVSELTYSTTKLVPGFDGNAFEVGGASRIPNGADTDTTADWVRNTYDGEGLPCFPNCGASTGDPTAPGEAYNTAGQPNRVVCASLVVSNSTFDTTRTFQTCGDLTVGPNVSLISPGVFGFFAGQTVSFVGDFDAGADLKAGTCGQNLCAAGSALEAACMPCVTDICAVDPYCCGTAWDGQCVAEAGTMCGLDCS
jgi:hypothetical protein